MIRSNAGKKSSPLLLAALCAAATTGCGTWFEAVSVAPPNRTARLDRESDHVEISRGVALGFECRDGDYAPCANAKASTDDPRVAEVFVAHIDKVSERWHWGGPNPLSGFVVVGKAPGRTKLRVAYANGSSGVLDVEVLDDPAPSKTLARP